MEGVENIPPVLHETKSPVLIGLKHNVAYHRKTLRVSRHAEEEYPESKNFRKLDLKAEMERDLLISICIVFHDLVPAYLRFYPILHCSSFQQRYHP